MTTGFIMQTLICVISMELLSLSAVTDVPPRETSPAAKSEKQRMFSQATPTKAKTKFQKGRLCQWK